MKYNYFSAAIFVLVWLPATLNAQNKPKIVDLSNSREYSYVKVQEQLKDHKWNFYKEIFIQYPSLSDHHNASIQDRINKRFKDIILFQLETDSFRVNLFEHLSQSLATFLKVNGKVGDKLGTYKDNKYKFTPDLEGVNFKFLACHNAVVTFVADFEYTTKFQLYDINEHFHYYQVFYFNLENGKEFGPGDVFKKSSEKELINLIEAAARKDAEHIPFNREGSNFFEELEDSSQIRKKELVDFDLKAGFAFPKAFSMAFFISKWTPCTQNLNGYELEIRLSLEELKKHLNPDGPFASLIKLQESAFTKFKNQNNPLVVPQHPLGLPIFFPYEFSPYQVRDSVKTVSIYHVVAKKLNNGETEIKHERIRQTEYLQTGFIKETRYYQYEKLQSVLAFTFDSNQNLVKKAALEKGVLEKSEDYTYDHNGNLLTVIETIKNSFPMRTYFFYTDKVALEEHYGKRNFGGGFAGDYTLNILDNNGLVTRSTVFRESSGPYMSLMKYDKNKKLLLLYNRTKLPLDDHVYVYDTLGRLMSHEYDKGRYLAEFKYDEHNNLTEEIFYDSHEITRIKKAEYDAQNRLIKYSLSDRYNSINTYIIEYEFW